MKFVPYMVLDEDIEVVHSIPYVGDQADMDGNTGDVYMMFEQPDDLYGIKTAVIDVDKILIIKRDGFDDEEMRRLINFTRNNACLVHEMVKIGGVMNA